MISFAIVVITAAWPAAADFKGAPTIIDGDSLEVEGQRVDLFGIDSPEPGTICWKESGDSFDCGRIATTALLDLTAGLEVVCAPVGEAEPVSADAIFATCTAGGFSLNRNMVHTGWAIADRSATDDAYVAIEDKAKTAKRGLWRWKVEPPPWPSR